MTANRQPRRSGRQRVASLATTVATAAVFSFAAHALTGLPATETAQVQALARPVAASIASTPTYSLSSDATLVARVVFALDRAASDVRVALVATPRPTDWVNCDPANATERTHTVTCALSASTQGGRPMSAVTRLTVKAA